MPTATADYPELLVEWLYDQGPAATNGSWFDLTPYVSSGSTSRGRRYETDHFETGNATISLVVSPAVTSSTRLFDPEWTSGPFYNYLVPMRQIRVSATWNAISYPVFRGFITDWGQTVQDDKLFRTTITAKDAFVTFEQRKLPSSPYTLTVLANNPTAYFPLNETGTVRATDAVGTSYGLYDNCQQGVTGLIPGGDAAAAFAHSLGERVVIENPNLISGYPFTISAMIRIDSSDPAGYKVIFSGLINPGRSTLQGIQLAVDGAGTNVGQLRFILNDGTHYLNMYSQIHVDDGLPHHVAIVGISATQHLLYVDGVNKATNGVGGLVWPGSPPDGYAIGNYVHIAFGDYGFGTNVNGDPTRVNRGTIDEVCVWDGTAVSGTRIAAHALAATGWTGDDTGTRYGRLLDGIGWASSMRSIATGISTLQPAVWSQGATAMSVFQGWADTELGAFFIDRSGNVAGHNRHYPLLAAAATTSQATFDDGFTAAINVYQHVDLPRDETLIRNPVIASRQNGISVIASDTTLVAKYGDRSWAAPQSQDALDASVKDRAAWLLARYKELGTRLAALTFLPRANTNLWLQALGRELGDRITVNRTPLATGNQISSNQIIERVEHTFAPLMWSTTFVGSPVDPGVNTYLILDDLVYGLLDTAKTAY
jgi:hypothetical protein